MNFMISLLGWFLWNWAEFSITKESNDETEHGEKAFPLRAYLRTHWETWVGSFFTIFLLLWIGHRQLNLDPFEVVTGVKLGWNDLYLLGSGAAWDAIIFILKKVKAHFRKKESEL